MKALLWSGTAFACLLFTHAPADSAVPMVGGGTKESPAVGPAPSFGVGGDGFVLVKNWDFGRSGTIKNIDDLNSHFQYHDQFNTICCGGHYGAVIVSPDAAHRINDKQPIEDPAHPVREFLDDSMKTYVVPLNSATTINPREKSAGSGSFQAQWKLPKGGSLLGQDLIWETRVRYVTPRYFWFATWACGNKWNKGAEMDLIESFGFDNGGGYTNYQGAQWHSNSVGGSDEDKYKSWSKSMAAHGIKSFDATQYHTWTWLYRKDDTYDAYVDGQKIQSGKLLWTLSGKPGAMLDMDFIFDGTWGHDGVAGVNHEMPVSEFAGTYYEWDYSRVYLR